MVPIVYRHPHFRGQAGGEGSVGGGGRDLDRQLGRRSREDPARGDHDLAARWHAVGAGLDPAREFGGDHQCSDRPTVLEPERLRDRGLPAAEEVEIDPTGRLGRNCGHLDALAGADAGAIDGQRKTGSGVRHPESHDGVTGTAVASSPIASVDLEVEGDFTRGEAKLGDSEAVGGGLQGEGA